MAHVDDVEMAIQFFGEEMKTQLIQSIVFRIIIRALSLFYTTLRIGRALVCSAVMLASSNCYSEGIYHENVIQDTVFHIQSMTFYVMYVRYCRRAKIIVTKQKKGIRENITEVRWSE